MSRYTGNLMNAGHKWGLPGIQRWFFFYRGNGLGIV